MVHEVGQNIFVLLGSEFYKKVFYQARFLLTAYAKRTSFGISRVSFHLIFFLSHRFIAVIRPFFQNVLQKTFP